MAGNPREGRGGAEALDVLRRGGLDLAGALAPPAWDALVGGGWRSDRLAPGSRSVLIVGSGGRSLGRALGEGALGPGTRNPVDDHSRGVLEAAVRRLPGECRALLYSDRLDGAGRPDPEGRFVDLVAVAEAAGLGRPGRLRLLLHPEYGPWLSIRGVLANGLEPGEWRALLGHSPDPAVASASYCDGCPAPCATACPAGALDGGALDVSRCTVTRLAGPPCDSACAARHACVLGREHAYAPAIEAHHSRASLAWADPGDRS